MFPRSWAPRGTARALVPGRSHWPTLAVGEDWDKVCGAGSARWTKSHPTHQTQPKAEAECSSEEVASQPRQLSTTDILAPATMKNAAKCDT